MEGRKEDSHREEDERRDEPAKECIEKANEGTNQRKNAARRRMEQREAARTSKEKNENNG